VVDQDGADGLSLGFAGLGVGGQDLLAGLELADRDGLAAGEQHLGAGGEAEPARRGRLFRHAGRALRACWAAYSRAR